MSVAIKYADKTLIDSGSFITFGPEETVLALIYRNETIQIRITFAEEEGVTPGQRATIEGPATLRLQFVNLKGPLPAYLNEPISLGVISGQPLWFRWVITQLISAKAWLIDYSFYVTGAASTTAER